MFMRVTLGASRQRGPFEIDPVGSAHGCAAHRMALTVSLVRLSLGCRRYIDVVRKLFAQHNDVTVGVLD
jgi:hypothetical protein